VTELTFFQKHSEVELEFDFSDRCFYPPFRLDIILIKGISAPTHRPTD